MTDEMEKQNRNGVFFSIWKLFKMQFLQQKKPQKTKTKKKTNKKQKQNKTKN